LILADQIGPSEAGKILVNACLDFLELLAPHKSLKHFPEHLMRFFLDEKVVEALGLEQKSKSYERMLYDTAMRLMSSVEIVKEHSSSMKSLAGVLNRYLLREMISRINKHRDINFNIPDSMKNHYKVK
jgi:hypothetical protein